MSNNKDPYLPPMRALEKKERDPYLPATTTDVSAELVTEQPAGLDVEAFVHDLLHLQPIHRIPWLGRYLLRNKAKDTQAFRAVINEARALLTDSGALAVSTIRFKRELAHAADITKLEMDIKKEKLELDLANLRKAKRAAGRDDD